MQFDMYHHYTVDEHTIRAIGLLSQIERAESSASIGSLYRISRALDLSLAELFAE